MENYDLKMIKKYYGEEMMHFSKSNFSTILETKGLLFSILNKHFAYNKKLYEDLYKNDLLMLFKNYIYGLIEDENMDYLKSDKSVKELLNLANYNFYECKNEREIKKFIKYYEPNEKLCTFNGGRLKHCYVFFAVKKNVDEIKRSDYKNPIRDDTYGTSVISIQFTRGSNNILSIKNRYNHTVDNPDATFSNNLENIKCGLTKAFQKEYGLNIIQNKFKFNLPGYVLCDNGKLYRSNCEKNNIHFCNDNIIINNGKLIDKYYKEKERYIFMDNLILDLKKKKIFTYERNIKNNKLEEKEDKLFCKIQKIDIKKEKNKKIINLYFNDKKSTFVIDKSGRIIEFYDNYLNIVGNNFLSCSENIKKLTLLNAEYIGDNFLYKNKSLTDVNLLSVKNIGNNFLYNNNCLKSIYLPNVINIKNNFMYMNKVLFNFYFPKIKTISSRFLYNNIKVREINMPCLQKIKNDFIVNNEKIYILNMPELNYIGNNFLYSNNKIEVLSLPKLEKIESNFMGLNKTIKFVDLPCVKIIKDAFLYENKILKDINVPLLEKCGYAFLFNNKNIISLDVPNLKTVMEGFLNNNTKMLFLKAPMLQRIGKYFLSSNNHSLFFDIPSNLKSNSFKVLKINRKK